ncbi:hypothetical protein BH10ACT1_BH10ACT1_36210 [soil metagenome]
MEELVLSATLILAVVLTVKAARASQRRGAPGGVAQLGVGLLCGTCGAIVAAVPYADVVPDAWEVPLLVAFTLALVGIVVVAVARWIRARNAVTGRHSRPRREAVEAVGRG